MIRRIKRVLEVDNINDEKLAEAILDYAASYSRVLDEPNDEIANRVMNMTENLIMALYEDDSLELLFKLDCLIESDHMRRTGCLR